MTSSSRWVSLRHRCRPRCAGWWLTRPVRVCVGLCQNRMSGLNEFFREVMRNPYLREDTAVREFLTQENKSTFDKYKKNCKANETEFGQAAMGINEGTKRVRTLLQFTIRLLFASYGES